MGWFGSVVVHLHRTLAIPMIAVGPRRLGLATAALGPLQPPSMGLSWEHPQVLTLEVYGLGGWSCPLLAPSMPCGR